MLFLVQISIQINTYIDQNREVPINTASVFSYRGEADRAFEWLENAEENDEIYTAAILGLSMFSNIKDDPRWQQFLERNQISPEQLEAIQFEVKLPD